MKRILFVILGAMLVFTACGKDKSAMELYEEEFGEFRISETVDVHFAGNHFIGLIDGETVIYTETDHLVKRLETSGGAAEWFDAGEAYVVGLCKGKEEELAVIAKSYDENIVRISCHIVKPDGKELEEYRLEAPGEMSFDRICMDAERQLYVVYGDLLSVFDARGSLLEEIALDTGNSHVFLADGQQVYVGQTGFSGVNLYRLTGKEALPDSLFEKKLSKTDLIAYYGNENAVQLYGTGGESAYLLDDHFLYAYSIKKQALMPVLGWMELGISEKNLKSFGIGEQGFAAFVENGTSGGMQLLKMQKDRGENGQKQQLVLACNGVDDALMKRVCEFNLQNQEYAVYVRNYETEVDPYTALNLDVAAGHPFDIIDLSTLPVEQYAKKGVLEDLSGYFDAKDYVDSYIRAITMDGKIYEVSPTFYVYTMLGNKETLGQQGKWDHDAYMAYLMEHEDQVAVGYADKNDLLRQMLTSGIRDYLKADASEPASTENMRKRQVDTENLTKLISFVQHYKGVSATELYRQGYGMFDLAGSSNTLLIETALMSTEDFRVYDHAYGGKLIAKGYPSETGQNHYMGLGLALGIGAKSGQKEAAWEFIRYFLEDQTQVSLIDNGFPTRKDTLEKLLSEKVEKKEKMQVTINGEEETIPYFTKEKGEELYHILESADELVVEEPQLLRIVQEEVQGYFAGQQTLDQIIDHLANRINLYLAENT